MQINGSAPGAEPFIGFAPGAEVFYLLRNITITYILKVCKKRKRSFGGNY